MKNRKCPNRSHCWDYKSGNCENCDLGDHITKLHKRIDRLKANNEELIYKLECLLCHATGSKLSKHTYTLQVMESAVNDYVEKCCDEARAEVMSEVERLKKVLADKGVEYDQALQDKARECNMAIDKICIEHRAKLALLHSSHEQKLAKAKREVAWEIFAELDTMDIRIVRLLDAIKYMDLVKKYEYKNN